MALLSQMIRSVAITGDASRVNAWFADRQGKEWAERTVRGALDLACWAANFQGESTPPAGTFTALSAAD